ncbi:MAG TPA: phosphate ABC transporter substrate-binding protein PstS [Candidatus Angelobacter sp.]
MASRISKAAWILLLFSVCLCGVPGFGQDVITLVGSGGSSPVPVYRLWRTEYNKRQPKLQMDYVVLGTSESIAQISKGNGDFGAGDTPLPPEERASGELLEVPIMVIGLVPIYNLPGVRQELRFSGKLLAQIFLGDVKTWNAPEIAQLNPQVPLPNLPIKVVYRTPGKGTNYIFTEFLSKASPRFKEKIGRSISPKWPVGVPAERSSDIADKVKGQAGAIGYAELQYARENNISYGMVQNADGKFVEATPDSLLAACRAAESPGWDKFGASLTNAPGADSYPLTSFSWIYVRSVAAHPARKAALEDLLNWLLSDGQQLVPAGYSKLPAPLATNIKAKVSSLK